MAELTGHWCCMSAGQVLCDDGWVDILFIIISVV